MDLDPLNVASFINAWQDSPFAKCDGAPWGITRDIEALIVEAIGRLGTGFSIEGQVAVHKSATIEPNAVIKGPAIVGPDCFIASSAYLRGGTYLDLACIIGPGCELKSSLMFEGSKLAHLNFVGDSILGSDVNVEAGAIVANYRNESDDKMIRIYHEERRIETGAMKFGALIGDGARIGANAVIAPGALLPPASRIGRLQLIDQSKIHARATTKGGNVQ